MQHKTKTTLKASTLSALLLFAVGCSNLTTENYNQIEMGMPYDDVVHLLGQADDCSSTMGLMRCTWGSEAKHISIQFAGGQVVFFSSKGL